MIAAIRTGSVFLVNDSVLTLPPNDGRQYHQQRFVVVLSGNAMIAGSSALDLGRPRQALAHFGAAAADDYAGDEQYPRSQAIYQARAAQAHLQLGDLDAAAAATEHAARCLTAVASARSADSVRDLRDRLRAHAREPVIVRVLEMTA